MRDFHAHPGNKFGEALRASRAAAKGDRTMRGEAKPVTGQEDLPGKPYKASAGNREGKPSHPSGTTKHDIHKVRGKVKRVEVEPVHGGHTLRVHYHSKKGKAGESVRYVEPETHFHSNRSSMNRHMGDLMDQMEPETADSSDLAKSI